MNSRNTQQQELLYSALLGAEKALSADELLEALSGQMNKTIVYRILEKFEKNRKAHSIIGDRGKSFYALCHGCYTEESNHFHIHFQCKSCNSIKYLPDKMIVPKLENHIVLDSHFLLTGICDQCDYQTDIS